MEREASWEGGREVRRGREGAGRETGREGEGGERLVVFILYTYTRLSSGDQSPRGGREGGRARERETGGRQ